MEKEFVPYELALELRELGFNDKFDDFIYRNGDLCIANDSAIDMFKSMGDYEIVIAPLYQQSFRWFREKHNLYHCICPSNTDNKAIKDKFFFELSFDNKLRRFSQDWYYHTYEESELECLKKLIEIVKSKQE